MANSLNTSSLVSKRMVQVLHAKSMISGTVNNSYSKDFTQRNYAPGDTISIDIVHQPSVTQNRVATVQDVKNRTVSATILQYNAAEKWSSIVKRYDMTSEKGVIQYTDDMSKRMIREVDRTSLEYMAKQASNSVGTPGVDSGSLRTYAEGVAKIDDALGGQTEDCFAAVNPMGHVALTDSLKGLQNPGKEISNQYLRYRMKNAAGINFYKSNSVSRWTKGTATNSTPVMNGATTSGASTISIDGLSAATATITEKTHFTIADVYAVDPETKTTLSYLKDFSVTATATGSGSAIAALAISPTIYDSTSPHQNVSALPADGAALTLSIDSTSAAANIIYDRDAYTLISVPLPPAAGGVHKFAQTENGIQIRTGFGSWDAVEDKQIFRIDAVWVMAKLREDHSCKVWGA